MYSEALCTNRCMWFAVILLTDNLRRAGLGTRILGAGFSASSFVLQLVNTVVCQDCCKTESLSISFQGIAALH